MNINDYPVIKCLVISIAASNGIINRLEPVEMILGKAEECLGADGVMTDDVQKLNIWLGSLSADELDTLADGEHEEMDAISKNCPLGEDGHCLFGLIEDIFPF